MRQGRQTERGFFEMKRFPRAVLLLLCILVFGVATSEATELSFEVISAAAVKQVDTDLAPMESKGMLLEIKVVNTGGETKLWPSDFSVGFNNGEEEVRITGFLMTNAVSDPEDEMGFRYFQGTAIRKGTRYFKLFFSEIMNWQLMGAFDFMPVEEATLYFKIPITNKFDVVPLPQEDDLGY